MNFCIKRNKGVFEAETRLWFVNASQVARLTSNIPSGRSCAIALPVYVLGLVISGVAFQKKLSVAAVVVGWAVREVAVMITTVAVCAPHPPRFLYEY